MTSSVSKLHIERLKAQDYYKHKSVGQVVLVNGHIVFHGKGSDAIKFEKCLLRSQNKTRT